MNITLHSKILVDNEDVLVLNSFNWNTKVKGYVSCKIKGKTVYLHRLLMNPDEGMVIDHINGIKTDNRKENLRICTAIENNRNRKLNSNNTSGFKGVYWNKNKQRYIAQVKINNKKVIAGTFKTLQEAALAYETKAKQLFGSFYRPTIG
jgi:hypothetical protein